MADPGLGSTPRDLDQQPLWNQFLVSLSQAIHLGQLLEPDNKNMLQPMERVRSQLNDIFRECASFTFDRHEQNILVNGQRLRADGPTYVRHMQFMDLLGARKIGGIQIRQPLSAAQWKEFILSVSRYNRESPTPFEDCARQVAARGLSAMVTLLPIETAAKVREAKLVRPDRRVFAARVYAKAMALLREYIRHLDDEAHRGYYHLKLTRVVQDLVAVCQEDGWKYFGVVNTKHYDEYLYNHSVNVAILSIILGARVGLRRSHLQELGMAALLHDVGKAFLPQELLRKTGPYTEVERQLVLRHPILGVQALLRVKQYGEGFLKRILVVSEHSQSVQDTNHHLYSRIIAIAETFDALTTDRPHRKGFASDAAVKMLVSMAGTRLDRDLVTLFVQTLGLFPCGTLVELNTGEHAIVFHPDPDPKHWMSPIVRLIRDAGGLPFRSPRQIELTGSDRYIVRTLDPVALGVNVSGYLLADADLRVTARHKAVR